MQTFRQSERARTLIAACPVVGGAGFDVCVVTHEDEIGVDEQVVRRLADRDVSEFRGRPLRRLAASGSSNVLFLLGEDHEARRREVQIPSASGAWP